MTIWSLSRLDFFALGLALLPELASGQCQVNKIRAGDGEGGALFGDRVAVDGDWLAVGALFDGVSEGAAYVYSPKGRSWFMCEKLLPSDTAVGDIFGTGLAMSGGILAVGASGKTVNGLIAAGAVYVFERFGGDWQETAKITASNPVKMLGLGQQVSTDGTRIVAAALSSGGVYVFRRDGPGWTEEQFILPSDPNTAELFGLALSLVGSVLVVGDSNSDGGPFQSGAAYVFEWDGTSWIETAKIISNDASFR